MISVEDLRKEVDAFRSAMYPGASMQDVWQAQIDLLLRFVAALDQRIARIDAAESRTRQS
jgi:hypothetical protein